ncbi:MAG: hypothetical protein IKQ40_06675, partial [Lachnospiraceae bacterium]|nr:hypothetical protein [Lachnospiraceae bacterium]
MASHIAAYDYCAFILLLIITFYYLPKRISGNYRGIVLALIIFVTGAASVCDATRVRFAAKPDVSDLRFLNVNFAYYMFFSVIPLLYLVYIIAVTDTWHIIRKIRKRAVMSVVPCIVFCIMLVANFFYPVVFSVGPGKELILHFGFYLEQLLFILYNLLTVWFLGKFIDPIDHKRYRILLIPVYICVTGVAVNLFWPEQHVLCFAVALCILMLVLISNRAEDAIDYATGMHTYKVFAEDMTTNFKSGKKMQIILLNIVNYK